MTCVYCGLITFGILRICKLAYIYCGTYEESGLPRSERRVHLLVVIYAYGPCRRIWQENSWIAADWNYL